MSEARSDPEQPLPPDVLALPDRTVVIDGSSRATVIQAGLPQDCAGCGGARDADSGDGLCPKCRAKLDRARVDGRPQQECPECGHLAVLPAGDYLCSRCRHELDAA